MLFLFYALVSLYRRWAVVGICAGEGDGGRPCGGGGLKQARFLGNGRHGHPCRAIQAGAQVSLRPYPNPFILTVDAAIVLFAVVGTVVAVADALEAVVLASKLDWLARSPVVGGESKEVFLYGVSYHQ